MPAALGYYYYLGLLKLPIRRCDSLSTYVFDHPSRLSFFSPLLDCSRQLLRRSSAEGLYDPHSMRNIESAAAGHFPSSHTVTAANTHHVTGGATGSPLLAQRRAQSSMSGRLGTRSWHPSPFASDDEISTDEPMFYKEEKKNRIKMEIARRRQQIEENACLHEELTRLAKLRESAEVGGTGSGTGVSGVSGIGINSYVTGGGSSNSTTQVPSSVSTGFRSSLDPHTVTSSGTSVLKSVDEILRDDHTSGYRTRSSTLRGGATTATDPLHSSVVGANMASSTSGLATSTGLHNNPMAATFNSDLYTSSVYDRVTDFSPINSDLSDFANASNRRAAAGAAASGSSGLGMPTGLGAGMDPASAAAIADPYIQAAGLGKYSKAPHHSSSAFK